MFASGNTAHLLIPADTRVLKPGKVVSVKGSEVVVEFEEPLKLEAGADMLLFASHRDKFFQQGVKIREVQEGPLPIVSFEIVGEPVSAEKRQIYRTTTFRADISADLDREHGCAVVDISPEGFAAISTRQYKIGAVVKTKLRYEDLVIELSARVQTMRVRPDGKFRYGFFAGDRQNIAKRALQQLNSEMQRQQLRRMKRGSAA